MSKPSPATVKERLLEWALDGNTDSSSLAVARVLLYGANNQEVDEFPREPVNLQRIEAVPEARETFPILATTSVFWAALIADWETLTHHCLPSLTATCKTCTRPPKLRPKLRHQHNPQRPRNWAAPAANTHGSTAS